MDIEFKIENQKLTRVENKDDEFIVNKSNKYLNLSFDFTTDDWVDTTRFCILRNGKGLNYLFEIDGTVNVAYDVVSGNNFTISCYGLKQDNTRITTNAVGILMHSSGYTEDISNIHDLTPTVAEDIYLKLNTKLNISAVDDELDINSADPVQNKVILTALNGKADLVHSHLVNDITDFPALANVAISGDYGDLTNKPTLESLGGIVNVIRQTIPDDDYFATYVITQAGSQVGVKINIPKDKFLKSCDVKTCTVEDVPEGFHVGDIYLDMVFNVESGERHQYVLLNALIDVYTADNVTLELVNGQFKVKNKGIGATQLADDINLKLGYAETFNSSACKNITSSDLLYWNAKQDATNLTTSWGGTLSDVKYPSEKLVKNTIDNYIGNINDYIGE